MRFLIIFVFLLVLFIALIGIAFYAFTALMFYNLAKKRRIDNPWLAWIPIANWYLMGEIAGAMNLFGKIRIEKTGLVLMLAPLALSAASLILNLFAAIPFIGVIFGFFGALVSYVGSLAVLVLYLCVLYRIYSPYVPKNTVLVYTLVSIISVTIPFFVYSILKKEPICEPYDFTF